MGYDHGDRSGVSASFRPVSGREGALTQPVAITRNGRERLVMISVDEYRKLIAPVARGRSGWRI